jgi:hypothetical protein
MSQVLTAKRRKSLSCMIFCLTLSGTAAIVCPIPFRIRDFLEAGLHGLQLEDSTAVPFIRMFLGVVRGATEAGKRSAPEIVLLFIGLHRENHPCTVAPESLP